MKERHIARFDFTDSIDDSSGRLRVPVACRDRPHHHLGKPDLPGGGMKLRPAKAEWRTNHTAMLPCGFEHNVFAAAQFVHNLAAGEEKKAGMTVRVISNGMTRPEDLRRQSGVLLHILTED